MNITIIGHGAVGGTLARVWAGAGHEVTIGARTPSDEAVRRLADVDRIEAASIPDAVSAAPDVILIAVPASAGVDVAEQMAAAGGAGRAVIIDATNAVGGGPGPYETVADALLDRLDDARVVKAFNTTGAENMADPQYGETALDMFVAGDDPAAKNVAGTLARDAGFAACYDVGDRRFFASLEHLARLWISLAHAKGHGRDIGFKLLRRPSGA